MINNAAYYLLNKNNHHHSLYLNNEVPLIFKIMTR